MIWSHKGDKSETMQITQAKEFASQIEAATNKYSKVIITGDANLCSRKWNEDNYTCILL